MSGRFNTVRTVLTLLRQFQHCPDSSNTVLTDIKWSGWFWFCPDGFQTVRTVLKLSGWYQNCLDRPFYMSHERLTLFFYMSRELFTRFFDVSQKRICALRPESFRAWKAAIRKVSGFCASGALIHWHVRTAPKKTSFFYSVKRAPFLAPSLFKGSSKSQKLQFTAW